MIPTKTIASVARCDLSSRQVQREFTDIIDSGARIHVAGSARTDPQSLLIESQQPRYKIELFDTRFYLTGVRQIPELRFFVTYVVQFDVRTGRPQIFARIFYKDLSLAWRSASHFTSVDDEIWIGKGDVRSIFRDGEEWTVSNESTTDLPLEMQTAMETVLGRTGNTQNQLILLELVLRQAPADRVQPYRDFVAPREKAAANSRNLINRGRPIARFKRKNDPTSLEIIAGYEPNFSTGMIESSDSQSKLFGGKLQRFRFLSENKKIQYMFFAGPTHVWILPPQATTTELSSFGVRTIDVVADDDLFIPGYEYHHFEETKNGLELYSQIPPGYAGEVCPHDDAKADASPWLEAIPLIQQFRRVMKIPRRKN